MRKSFNLLFSASLLLFSPCVLADDVLPIPTVFTKFVEYNDNSVFMCGLAVDFNNYYPEIKAYKIWCKDIVCFLEGAILYLNETPELYPFVGAVSSDYTITKQDKKQILAKADNEIGISYINIDIPNKTAYITNSFNNKNTIEKLQIITDKEEVDALIKKIIVISKQK